MAKKPFFGLKLQLSNLGFLILWWPNKIINKKSFPLAEYFVTFITSPILKLEQFYLKIIDFKNILI